MSLLINITVCAMSTAGFQTRTEIKVPRTHGVCILVVQDMGIGKFTVGFPVLIDRCF